MESKIQISIILAWFLVFALMAIIIFISQSYRTKLLRMEKEKQKIGFKAAIEAEEKQKEKIANNFHDEMIPFLTALRQNIQQNKKSLAKMTLSEKDLDKDVDIIDQCINGIRVIALDLVPNTFLNFGLLKALEQYFGYLNSDNILVELEINTNFKNELPLSKQDQLNVYRICTEISNNLQKHTNYSCLRVSVGNDKTHLLIQFQHDGKGITNQEIELLAQSSTGLGLKSLKARVLILNATIDYTIEMDMPTINLKVPYNYE